MNKEFMDRLIELVKDDKELHDATVKLIESLADMNRAKAYQMRNRKKG